ncbi:MAG: hypothetical protein K9W43_02125 [Candidatus Thorarchaeota archaeon]|nr:hypothetical protein [Candidatus Thorarchaeota archaeon]
MGAIFVVDAGVLFTKWVDKNPDAKFVTTDEIVQEVRNRPSKQRIDFLLSTGRLRVESYDPRTIVSVKKAGAITGDRRVLSEVDTSLLALALTRQQNGLPAIVVSKDLALLNTALALDLKVVDPSGRLKRKITWGYRCPSCKHIKSTAPPDLLCPICGTQMRRTALKSRPL